MMLLRTRRLAMHRRVLALALAGFACGALLAAQEAEPDRIDPERPDFTNGTGIVAPGRVQVETGYTFTRRGDERRHALGAALVRAGVAPQAEARLVLNSYDWIDGPDGRRQGLEDPALEVKVRLTGAAEHRPPGLPAVALFLATTVPAGARPITADAWQPTGKLALGWHLSEQLDLSSNPAYSPPAEDGRRFGQPAASRSLSPSRTAELASS